MTSALTTGKFLALGLIGSLHCVCDIGYLNILSGHVYVSVHITIGTI